MTDIKYSAIDAINKHDKELSLVREKVASLERETDKLGIITTTFHTKTNEKLESLEKAVNSLADKITTSSKEIESIKLERKQMVTKFLKVAFGELPKFVVVFGFVIYGANWMHDSYEHLNAEINSTKNTLIPAAQILQMKEDLKKLKGG